MDPLILVLLALAVIAGLVLARRSSSGSSGSMPPAHNGPSRKGLYFGYYTSGPALLEQYRDHANLLWCSAGPSGAKAELAAAKTAGMQAVLYLQWACYTRVGTSEAFAARSAAAIAASLKEHFDELRAAGVLEIVAGLCPIDEPDVHVADAVVITQVNAALRGIMAEYAELARAALVVTYSGASRLTAIDTYDWVSFDNYGAGAAIFTRGDYQRLKAAVKPAQRIFLVPGGADPWKQDPTPFYDMAQADPQVLGILAFLWQPYDGGQGIGTNGMAEAYRQVGLEIKEA